jgi:uncharacterized protein (DUF983 family)
METIRENKNIIIESLKNTIVYDLQCPACGKKSTFSGFLTSDIVICPSCQREFLVDFKKE